MWYVIYSRDRENALEARLRARPDHLVRVNALVEQGRRERGVGGTPQAVGDLGQADLGRELPGARAQAGSTAAA